jgi:hypothetical protein
MPIVLRTKADLSALARHESDDRHRNVLALFAKKWQIGRGKSRAGKLGRYRIIKRAAGVGCWSEHGLPPIFLRAERSNPQLELFVAHMRERVAVNRQHIQCGGQ